MKKDEPFSPDIKSSAAPENLIFRLVQRGDRDVVTQLMAARNPEKDLSEVYKTTDRELHSVETDPNYRLYVAELDGKVVGFCRFYHSSGLPASKKVYPAPEGWYGMGILVDPEMRRQGIARFLFANRIRVLKEQGVQELYSIVDAKNLTSLRMHREFGFLEVARGAGFLQVKLESGDGYLFKAVVG